ncbi:Retrotransposable element [Durusdinium trenchii]|uniref:Retrotransposable element n=1 Tax=Durusdinium trenchii TaxID=1381693 RepID=A0ABP0LV49_9DINO
MARLKPGTAVDALGWCTESFSQIGKNPLLQVCLTRIMDRYLTNNLPSCTTGLINMSMLLPLNKDGKGGIRPISIPTCFRKVIASLTLLEHASDIQAYVEPEQHGAGMASGAYAMASKLERFIREDPGKLVVQADIANAFSTASRQSALQALAECNENLCKSQFAWLCQPARAVLMGSDGTRHVLETSNGIPQGDPLSALVFACLLRLALGDLRSDTETCDIVYGRDYHVLAYADDVVMVIEPDCLHVVWEKWKASLAQHHLQVQPDKTVLFHPSGIGPPPGGELADVWRHQGTTDGVVLCGYPIWDEQAGSESHPAIPVGQPRFLTEYLEKQLLVVQARLNALSTLPGQLHGEDTQHIATYLLRSSVLAKHVHLLRAIPTPLILKWARQVDDAVRECVTRLLDLPALNNVQETLLTVPVSFGGLGFHSLAMETAPNHIAHVLATHATWGAYQDGSDWPWGFAEAADLFEDLCDENITHVLGKSDDELRRHGFKHATPLLHTALYRTTPVPRTHVPAMAPTLAHRANSLKLHFRFASMWYHCPGKNFVRDAVLRTAVRYHLQLPLLPEGHRCGYAKQNAATPCGHLGDEWGRHANHCCAGPIQHRHNKLRDEWSKLGKLAGWHCSIEQLVTVHRARAPEGEEVRGDLIMLTPGGRRICVDVAVTHSWDAHTCAQALCDMERIKLRKYGVEALYQSLPNGELFYPVVHHPSGHMGVAGLALAEQILQDMVAKMVAEQDVPKSVAVQMATSLVYGSLGRALMYHECRVLAASAPLVAARLAT